ncbi:hypothetical protein LXL04_021284 [Taraxacum kok-saghyz]
MRSESSWNIEGILNKTELEKYLGEDREAMDVNFDILKWWGINKCRYPVLSKMARDVLAIPVSSVASESAFSTGGRILDSFRTSLTPRMVEALVCTQDWVRDCHDPINVDDILLEIEKLEEEGLKDLTVDQPTIIIDETVDELTDNIRGWLQVRYVKLSIDCSYLSYPYLFYGSNKDLVTYNFTSLIGKGAFGPAFKAQMTVGEAVVVKVLTTDSKQGEKEFQIEVMLLGRLHHKNLVEEKEMELKQMMHSEWLLKQMVINKSNSFVLFSTSDVVSIPKTIERFLLLYDTKGRFRLPSVRDEESKGTVVKTLAEETFPCGPKDGKT